jgi:D-alanyl-lipoteichoic acid acyltransferase DltB (MBOAT superfamily)
MAFLIFFAIVYLLYVVMQKKYKWQNVLLFFASYVFYGWWDVRFLSLLVYCTLTAYSFSLLIDKGKLELKQYFKVSGFLLGTSFFCNTLNWKALGFSLSGVMPNLSIKWN